MTNGIPNGMLNKTSNGYPIGKPDWLPNHVPNAMIPNGMQNRMPNGKQNWRPNAMSNKNQINFHMEIPKCKSNALRYAIWNATLNSEWKIKLNAKLQYQK